MVWTKPTIVLVLISLEPHLPSLHYHYDSTMMEMHNKHSINSLFESHHEINIGKS